MLEQPLDHGNRALGFHAKHRFAQSRGSRRTEQPGSFEPRFAFREIPQRTIDDLGEHRARLIEVRGRDRAMARRLPLGEERLKHFVDELTLPPRVHDLFVVGLFFELQNVLREKLERTRRVRFERADRPRRLGAVSGRSVKDWRVRRRAPCAHSRPLAFVVLHDVRGVRSEPDVGRQSRARHFVEQNRTADQALRRRA